MKKRPKDSAEVRAELLRERRKNRHLRTLLDELERQVRQNRRDLEVQFARLAQLQAEVDRMKRRGDVRVERSA